MKDVKFFETILDNMTDGIYILDDKGNYIFVNSKYVNMTGISKTRLLRYNVYDFLKEGQIKVLISDIVYRNKNTVNMLQNVDISGGKHYQQLVISTPIFDEKGNVRNILAICRDVTTIISSCLSVKNLNLNTLSHRMSREIYSENTGVKFKL